MYINIYIHTLIYTCIHTYIYIHANIHTYIYRCNARVIMNPLSRSCSMALCVTLVAYKYITFL